MTHNHSTRDATNDDGTADDGTADDESETPLTAIGRRSYLKTAAAAAVGGLAATGFAKASPQVDASVNGSYTFNDNGDHYEYVVHSNSKATFDIRDGDVVQNVLVDITAPGAAAGFYTTLGGTISSNWTIRNVGVTGTQPSGGDFIMVPASHDGGLVEHVYLGDGATNYPTTNYGPNPGCMWVPPDMTGHVTVREVYMAGWIDNGMYFSAPSGSGPNFTIENCYAYNNTISCYRVGNGDVIRNSFCEASNSNTGTHRGIWLWQTGSSYTIEDCTWRDESSLDYGLVIADNSTANVSGSNYDAYTTYPGASFNDQGGNTQESWPSSFMPDGVPTTALDAATGAGSESIVGDEDAHEFEIEGPGEFYLEVDEVVEPDPSIAPYTTYGETHGDDWVSFELSESGSTHWWYKHDIVDLQFTDDQTVYIDGEEYDEDDGEETVIIEDFDRADPLAAYGGATSLFGTTSDAYEGSQALTNDSGSFGGVNSTSGLDAYPERGDEVHVHFQNAGDDNFVSFNFFAQSETDNADRYSVGISGAGAWRMWRVQDSTVDTIATDDLSSSEQISGWYRAEISTDDTTISAELYDDSTDELIASISADDTTYSSGGIGFRSAGNGEVWDYVIFPGEEPSGPPVVDDYERADPIADYGGATTLYDTTSSPVYEGSQALVNDGGSFGSIASTSGLEHYPERGDEVHVHFTNAADDNFVAFHLFAQAEVDNPDSYSVGISGASAWRMWRHDGGNVDEIASADLPASEQISGWYRAEVWSDSTTVYADLYDDSTDELIASISADDTTYDSGGIGFRSAGNGEVWDYVILDE